MYQLCLQRDFRAQHYLIGGDWGPENDVHGHDYRIELRLSGESLDEHEYLVDLVEVERHLDAEVDKYRGRVLNDLEPFSDRNPSLELFARIMSQALAERIAAPQIREIEVRLWENEQAWASYSMEI
ncbi:MAG: 6-carboxytetrahydropterin synthase [Anaerolineales bacterium]|nr:6-carboxytetrahydropterin synthase [Anaerolineales bacterium]